ncbi:Homoserine O-acetyltransferase [Methyloligella halotolerans]|uniref:Homoserine O-acetyltransferase n=1 Tax=Methyloligella halotolerans TaxID=1177755 RepID=A0A1E2RZ95_9HYPH|nr:alpha/beta fold hydrolase [Methyloligella halotolerans]ODA67425.1 Homoserine O-acetyltransferase [Methyloligella halotolerans]
MTAEFETFALGDVTLQSGETLKHAKLAYKTYGTLSSKGDNAVLMPTFYTGTHTRNEAYFGPGRAIDPARHFIVSINMFGNGLSSSPSNTVPEQAGHRFPRISLYDNVVCQHRLVVEELGIDRLALVIGWSMAGCQTYHWGALYPDMVEAILPFCASAKTSPHNIVFLEGVKAALQADCAWKGGDYDAQPVAGLKAFARVYAGWAYSQAFFRDGLYRQLGYETIEALLQDWEADHVDNWDANDLMAKLWAWQNGDISANGHYGGDIARALESIRPKAILIPSTTDLYFPPEDNALEAERMPNAEFRPYASDLGHCAASPGKDPAFASFLDRAVADLLS